MPRVKSPKPNVKRPKRYLSVLRNANDKTFDGKFDEAVEYYRGMVEEGRDDVPVRGNLEELLAATPGLSFFYKTIRTDAQQTRRWLETLLTFQKATKYKWFQSEEGLREYGELKTTEIVKYIEADDYIGDLSDSIRVMADCEHQLQDLVEAFDSRGIMLSKIVDARNNGNEEVWVDPYRETTNE